MESAKPEKGTRGGRREGAGRKCLGRTATISAYVTPEDHVALSEMARAAGKSMGQFIADYILRGMK